MSGGALLEVENLTVTFPTEEGPVTAVDDLSFTIGRGETLVIVGESGSGKSVTSLAVMGLIAAAGPRHRQGHPPHRRKMAVPAICRGFRKPRCGSSGAPRSP